MGRWYGSCCSYIFSADTKSEIWVGLKVEESKAWRCCSYFQRDEDTQQMLPGQLCSPSGGGGSRGSAPAVPGALPEEWASLRGCAWECRGLQSSSCVSVLGTSGACQGWSHPLNCSQRRWDTANEAGFGTFFMLCKYPSENVLQAKIVNAGFISASLFCSIPGMNLIGMLPSVHVNTMWYFYVDG